MTEPSLKKNFFLSTAYQVLVVIIPFITAPYISRVLGPEGVGIYSYTNSLQMYFSMFAALGTVSYGTREIARVRNDRAQRSQLFWEIECLTIVTSLICLLGWGVFVALSSQYRIYYAILTFSLVAVIFDISWFFAGMEEFKYTVSMNGLFKILGVVALFLFVKEATDVPVYTLIMALTLFLGNASMWIYLRQFIDKVPIKSIKLKKHFKETLIYFVPTIATSIYTVLDKTLIGIITQEEAQNGFYEQATKIINMCKALTFAALNSVLGSRISFLFIENKIEEIKERINFSLDYIMFMGVGLCFGILAVAGRFVPLFFGPDFEPVTELLYLMSPLIIIIGISNCLGSQYYTPAGLRSRSAKFIVVGATVNFVLNIILIPVLLSKGAVIASLIAEMLIMGLYVSHCNDYTSWKSIASLGWKKITAGIVMLAVLLFLQRFIQSDLIAVLAMIPVGVLIFASSLFVLRDSFMSVAASYIKEKIGRK